MFTFLFLFGLAIGTVTPSEEPAEGAVSPQVELALETASAPNDTMPALDGAMPPLAGGNFFLSNGDCPLFWQSFNGHCYKYIVTETNWADAELNCVSHNANLVNIHSLQELNFIGSMIQNYGPEKYTWIGLTDIHKEGAWMWSDGSAVDFLFWHQGEPNNSGDEKCVHALTDPYDWNDIACSNKYPSICELRMTCPK